MPNEPSLAERVSHARLHGRFIPPNGSFVTLVLTVRERDEIARALHIAAVVEERARNGDAISKGGALAIMATAEARVKK